MAYQEQQDKDKGKQRFIDFYHSGPLLNGITKYCLYKKTAENEQINQRLHCQIIPQELEGEKAE